MSVQVIVVPDKYPAKVSLVDPRRVAGHPDNEILTVKPGERRVFFVYEGHDIRVHEIQPIIGK